ncbi:MAG TPA: DUF2306 domain-containing protein [Sphingomicrobium sp.]|nr:DUF2306 domain-containing protein [Sphingomicrobium sp.]
MSNRQAVVADRVKWSFFGLMGLCVLLVLWVDERFWFNSADPHWKHIAPVKYLLMIHGLAGATALGAGALQMSSRIRRTYTALHHALGKVYIGAVSVAAPVAIYMGTSTLEPVTIRFEQIFQGGFWWLSALIAWACIRSGQMQLHKAWMMRSYAFTLIFITSRVPDVFVKSYSDQFLSDMLWGLVAIGLVAPEIILTTQTLWRIRTAKMRKAETEVPSTLERLTPAE